MYKHIYLHIYCSFMPVLVFFIKLQICVSSVQNFHSNITLTFSPTDRNKFDRTLLVHIFQRSRCDVIIRTSRVP